MEGGALFKVRSEAKEQVLAAFAAINISKNVVSGYAYNDANTLITEIKRVLTEQMFEDSTDRMKGLLSTAKNILMEYKATISIKRKDVLKDSKDVTDCLSNSSGTPVQPEIAMNSDAQEEADRQNTYQLAAIGVKEGVAAGITKIVGKDITNPILRTSDSTSFKSVDEYQLHQRVTTITEGAERPEATTIRQQFVNIAGMVFDWRDTVAINIKKFATNPAKTQAYGIRVHDDLKAVVILANVEWAAQQSWGTEISVAHRTIKAKYRYNHTHNMASINEILKVLTRADEARDWRKATAPGEKVEMVSQGLESLRQLVQQQPSLSLDSSDTENAYATTNSEDGGQSRGRSKGRRRMDKKSTLKLSPSPSTSRSPTPPPSKGRSRSRRRSKRNKKEVEQQGWILVDKGSKLKCKPDQYYIELSNTYSSLAEFSVDPSLDDAPTSAASLFKLKSMKCQHQQIQCKIKKKLKDATDTDDTIIKQYINLAEDECTEMAKSNKSNARRVAIDTASRHPPNQNRPCYNRARTSAACSVQVHADWSAKSPTPTSIASRLQDMPW